MTSLYIIGKAHSPVKFWAIGIANSQVKFGSLLRALERFRKIEMD